MAALLQSLWKKDNTRKKRWQIGTYDAVERILILVEDDPQQLANLETSASRYFGRDPNTGLCSAGNVNTVIDELRKYAKTSPNATIHAILDYNMGFNDGDHRNPTETLFYQPEFQRYLINGGIVIIYSGFPEQVLQSPAFQKAPGKYENLVLLFAEKGQDRLEDVLRVVHATTPDKIQRLREMAQKYQFDLGKMINAMRGRAS